MTQHIGVGDPAASSLSSCLCPFPGGFSLLTETGLLRPYLVAPIVDSSSHATTAFKAVEAATTVQVSTPSRQGSFPVDRDIPVDHAWSRDGRLLVVLRRSSFSAYCRRNTAATTTTTTTTATTATTMCGDIMLPQTRPAGNGRRRTTTRAKSPIASPSARTRGNEAGRPSLDLELVHTGRNGFEGKVVACCSLRPAAAAAPAAAPASSGAQSNSSSNRRHTYLICIGGTFGIERHALDVAEAVPAAPNTSTGTSTGTSSDAELATERHQQPAEENGSPPGLRLRVRGINAKHDPRPRGEGGKMTATDAELAATCQPLTSLFHGYPVVAIAISPDSGLVAAAAMTGHVRVWEISSKILAVAAAAAAQAAQAQAAPVPQQQKEPAGRGRRGKGKRSSDGGRAMRSPRPRRGSEEAVLWSVAVSCVSSCGFFLCSGGGPGW